MKRPLALLIAAVVALLGAGCSASTLHDAATVRYSVKGAMHTLHVSRDQLLSEVKNIVANKPFADFLKQQNPPFTVDPPDSRVTAIWLSQLIQSEAIDALFASRHLHVTKAIQAQAAKDVVQLFPTTTPPIFPAFSRTYRAVLTDREARTEALLASYADTSDAAGEAFFKTNGAQFCPSGKEVSHILLKTQAAAQGILDQLTAGASFPELAKTKSTDPSGAKGGVLGCLAAREFLAPFQKAADAAPLGTPVGPVKTQFGYHVILVTKPTYADARTQVLQALRQQGSQRGATAIDALIKSFKVHLDPRFGTWGPTKTAQGQTIYHVTEPSTPKVNNSREGSTTTTAPVAPGSP